MLIPKAWRCMLLQNKVIFFFWCWIKGIVKFRFRKQSLVIRFFLASNNVVFQLRLWRWQTANILNYCILWSLILFSECWPEWKSNVSFLNWIFFFFPIIGSIKIMHKQLPWSKKPLKLKLYLEESLNLFYKYKSKISVLTFFLTIYHLLFILLSIIHQ